MVLAGDLACFKTGRADVEPLRGAGHNCPNPLDVGIEASFGAPVRVRHVVPEFRPLGADVTDGGHGELPEVMK